LHYRPKKTEKDENYEKDYRKGRKGPPKRTKRAAEKDEDFINLIIYCNSNIRSDCIVEFERFTNIRG